LQAERGAIQAFFCPILYKDEDVRLCKAHIINQAFSSSSREWTIQRQDVDNFYGTMFEPDFLGIEYKANPNLGNLITDKKLYGRFSAQFLLEGEPIDYFVTDDVIPSKFSKVQFENEGQIIQLGLKISPDEMLASMDKKWDNRK
jgi:hypothetical protein